MIKILFVIGISFFINSCFVTNPKNEDYLEKAGLWDKTETKKFLKISELKKKKIDLGKYETEGYFIESNTCHCPANANCTCFSSTITIAEQPNSKNKDQIIKINTHAEGFQTNQKYGFKLELSELSDGDFYLVALREK